MLLDDRIGRTQIESVGQPTLYLGCAIFLRDAQHTVLGDETFRLVSLSGRESISTPFEFQLTLHGNSEAPRRRPIVFKDLLGCRVSFGIALPDSAGTDQRVQAALRGGPAAGVSVFNGMVASFAMLEPGVYRLTARSSLWKLTLANRYRVYGRKNIRDAIREVCELHGVNVAFRNLADDGSYNLATSRVQDWLQAGESDLEFLERLMSKAHLYYVFDHSAGHDTVVFANDTEYPSIPGKPALRYTHTSIEDLGLQQSDVITEYSYEQTLSQSGVRGAFTRQEEAWEQDGVATFQTLFKPVGQSTVEPTFNLHKIYQYGVNDQLATEFATVAAESLQAAAARLSGASHCPRMRCGYTFQTIEAQGPGNRPNPVRPTLDGQWFALTEVRHEASLDGIYRNEFVAISAQGPLVQVSVRDTQQGTVLATVVTDGHGSAPNDWRYYSRNNFDPEQSRVTDTGGTPRATDLQGVHVRFATDPESAPPVWVKLAPHMQSAPEIGALVIVTRANDESELPEIQNVIEAPGQMTVVPSRWLAETRVGNNYSTGFGDSKSIHYGKDSPVDLQQAIQLVENQYASGQFRDVSYSKGARYSYDTSEQGRTSILSSSESHGSTYSRSEGAERRSWEDIDYTYSEQTLGNSDAYSTTTGRSYSESTVGTQENHHTVQQDSSNYETINGKSYSESVHGSSETHSTVNGGSSSYETTSGARYSTSTANSTVENHSTVQGMSSSYETFNGGRYNQQTVVGLSSSLTTIAGVDSTTSLTAVANRNNVTGLSNDNTATGASLNIGVVGDSTDVRATGSSTSVHVVGSTTDISLCGDQVRCDIAGTRMALEVTPLSINMAIKGTQIDMPTIQLVL